MNTYNDEKISLVFGRWSKLHKEFHKEGKGFDMSKIPDLYDCVKYDAIHNGNLKLAAAPALFLVAKQLADFVIPQEYGTTSEAKHDIARRIGGSMFQLIAHHVRFTIITIPGAYALVRLPWTAALLRQDSDAQVRWACQNGTSVKGRTRSGRMSGDPAAKPEQQDSAEKRKQV
jgi:hypothetical protein